MQIRTLEAKVIALIDADPLWLALDTAFRQIKGVADRTVARLLANLPEIGTLSGKAVAKLTGLAPIAQDSGKKSGKRPVRGGREAVRSILYTVANSSGGTSRTSRRSTIRREAAKGGAHRAGTQAAGAAECQGARRAKVARTNGLTREGHNSAVEQQKSQPFLRPGLTNR
jgi:transposase